MLVLHGRIKITGKTSQTAYSIIPSDEVIAPTRKIRSDAFTADELDILRTHYPERGSLYCHRLMSRTRAAIRNKARELGLRIIRETRVIQKKEKVTRKKIERNQTYLRKIAQDQFDKIEKPEVAYFLGYLWADGHVSFDEIRCQYSITLTISTSDYVQVEKPIQSLGAWNVYHHAAKPEKNQAPKTEIRTGNKPLTKWFVEHDFDRKTFVSPTKILAKIPDHLKHYLWRGVLDGDGNLSLDGSAYRVTFAGHHDTDWIDLQLLLNSLKIEWRHQKRIHTKSRSSVITFHNKERFAIFCRYVYQDMETDQIGLQRKYQTWLKAKQDIELSESLDALKIEGFTQEFTGTNILKIIETYDGLVSRRKLVEFFGVKYGKLKFMLERMKRSGFIRQTGHGDNHRYYRTEKIVPEGFFRKQYAKSDYWIKKALGYTAIDLSQREGTEQMP